MSRTKNNLMDKLEREALQYSPINREYLETPRGISDKELKTQTIGQGAERLKALLDYHKKLRKGFTFGKYGGI